LGSGSEACRRLSARLRVVEKVLGGDEGIEWTMWDKGAAVVAGGLVGLLFSGLASRFAFHRLAGETA